MALPDQTADKLIPTQPRLSGERIAFLGRLDGMTRQEACELVQEHGGLVSSGEDSMLSLIVVGDQQTNLASILRSDNPVHERLAADVAAGHTKIVRESELWSRLGLVGDESAGEHTVHRLYTPAMLAELLSVPAAAIRRWHRRGTLVACRYVRRLPYFDFKEVAVARHLAALFHAGCSLSVIDRKLTELHRSLPDVDRPLADPAVVISGRQLILRRGDDLAEPGGQLLIDFDKVADPEESEDVVLTVSRKSERVDFEQQTFSTVEQLQLEALEWEDQGELDRAVETYRALLMAAGPKADTHFALADLLYQMGDLAAARERFYAAIELDEEYVEARANLGCVLAENNELTLAVAAFEGALAFHPDYADVHYHLANALDRLEKSPEAEMHWRTFLALAPESPWAEMARARLGIGEEKSMGVTTN